MAPHIQPPSLFRLCLSRVSGNIDAACTNIFLEHGCYGNQDCLDAIRRLQSFLISQLPLAVFEQLSEERRQHYPQQLLWSKDPRIQMAVFLHPNISRFNVDAKCNELFQLQSHGDSLDDFFWCSQLGRLSNLVYLNLKLITTDEILLLVGQSCPKLEVVNIVARIKQDMQELTPGLAGFKYCVSDIGLRALKNCTRLRHVTLNRIVQYHSSSGGEHVGISLEGVRDLVLDLPCLQYINFNSMGKLLDKVKPKEKQTKLTYYSEIDPMYIDIPHLANICPSVSHVVLSVPNLAQENASSVNLFHNILNALADSELPLRKLELYLFPFEESFRHLLRQKGRDLEDLNFVAKHPIKLHDLQFIGAHCPNIQKLYVKDVISDTSMSSVSICEVIRSKPFSHLSTLYLSGTKWNPHHVLPLLLSSATGLKQLTLINLSYSQPLDGALQRTWQHNSMRNLQILNLYVGCSVSLPIIRRLVFDFPNLRHFTFLQGEDIDLLQIEALTEEIKSTNLDIQLNCLELLDLPEPVEV